jgi:hypothetical protein
MANAQTVHDVTYDLLRSLGLKTVFGNPGSTEQAEVYGAPLPDRVSFPENHPLYRGELPMTIAGANEVCADTTWSW